MKKLLLFRNTFLIRIVALFIGIFTSCDINAQCPDGGKQIGKLGSGGFEQVIDSAKKYLEWFITGVAALDPNEITGPTGYAAAQWVSIKEQMNFRVDFENDGEFASAPAQNVFVRVPLPKKFNINSFRLGSVGFGTYHFQTPDKSPYYSTRLDLRDSLGLYVDFSGGIDIVKNELFWTMRSIDPLTGVAPTDAFKGFLPVSDTSKSTNADTMTKGMGYVTFTITPDSTDITGDTTNATASIVFDNNEPLETNTWTNTVDAFAPTSRIDSAIEESDKVTLFWSGNDDSDGSGLRDYAIYVSVDGGNFTLYKDKLTSRMLEYPIEAKKAYCFYTVAKDNTGNRETLKTSCEYSIGSTLPVTWLSFNGTPVHSDVLLTWATATEKNTKHFIIERSLNGRLFDSIGLTNAKGNSTLTNNYRFIDIDAMHIKTAKLYYRLMQVDRDGKYIYSSIITIPVQNGNNNLQVKAYPNPFNQNITIEVINRSTTTSKDFVELFTNDGKSVYHRSLGVSTANTVLLENLPLLPAGIYYLSVVINKEKFSIKMIRL